MFTKIELFAGAGGLALGLEQAGFEILLLNDFDKSSCETLKMNRPKWNIIHEDIVKLSERNLLEELNIKKGELDLLSGGFPCQSFSYAGKKMGINDVRGTMFYYFAKQLEQFEPKMFLAENVKGLVSHDNGRTLQTIIDVFTNTGYNVSWRILNAWDYGVAQKRERIVIIGIRKDLRIEYNFPPPYANKLTLKDILKNVPSSVGAKYSKYKKEILELVPQGGCWRDLPEDIKKEYMGGSYFLGGGKTGIARRISWDEPCLTLTCSPVQKQTERCHPEETRPFTVREYARIQSFPDDWQFYGTVTSQYKQIGNAVPVNLAREIGISIIKALEGGI